MRDLLDRLHSIMVESEGLTNRKPGAVFTNPLHQEPAAGEPIPGSTLDIQRQRQQDTQQRPLEFTGRWLVRSTVTGETVHRISGIGNVQDLHIGNVQADANRQAARWARSTGFDDTIEVVPEMG